MALTPEYLGKVPKNIVALYQELEDFIIEDFSRRLAKVGNITDTGKWQIMRAKEFGISNETLKKKIAEVSNLSDKEIDKLFRQSAIDSINMDNAIYEQAKLTPMHLETSPVLQQYLEAAVIQTKGELKNITQSLGFCVRGVNGKVKNRKLTEYYQHALDLAQFQISSGVLDYNTAIRRAIKDISDSGVRFINYESGYHNRIDVAVRRATLTGVNQMSNRITTSLMNELDCEYVEVSAHAGARPSHQEWQGQVYCRKGSTKEYKNFEEATGYGTGEGLCGWNCRHSFFPFFPGISSRTYTEEDLKNIDPPNIRYKGKVYTHYEATQKQRQIETRIRATKRELIGYNAIDDKEAFTQASIKLQRQKQEYKKFSKVANLKMQNERMQEFGFNKSVAQKAVIKQDFLFCP